MEVKRATLKLKKAAMKMVVIACSSFYPRKTSSSAHLVFDDSSVDNIPGRRNIHPTEINCQSTSDKVLIQEEAESTVVNSTGNNATSKNLCAICLEALSYGNGNSPEQTEFTAQCSHAFHFNCISSIVRHGNVTCPICRAHWTWLPHHLTPPYCNPRDPVLQILDDSIATSRVNRRSKRHSARYDDDDPIETDQAADQNCLLDFSLGKDPQRNIHFPHHHRLDHLTGCSSLLPSQPSSHGGTSSAKRREVVSACLSVKLAEPKAKDLILVASPNGPHLRLLKQSMALVVFSLRDIDRLAIVTCYSSATRIFPLRCMTSYGKQNALQVIEKLLYMGQADPTEGINKALKILEDRVHKNPSSCILYLSDSPTRSYHSVDVRLPVSIHRFHVGSSYAASNGFIMNEFEGFLGRLLRGVIQNVQLRIGEDGWIVRLGELKGDEEKSILLELNKSELIIVGYSYLDSDSDECTRTGETILSINNTSEAPEIKREDGTKTETNISRRRASSAESWDYHDYYMARRWAKYLHGYSRIGFKSTKNKTQL